MALKLPSLLNFDSSADTLGIYVSTGLPATPTTTAPTYISFDPTSSNLNFSPGLTETNNSLTLALVLKDGVTSATSTYCLNYQITNNPPSLSPLSSFMTLTNFTYTFSPNFTMVTSAYSIIFKLTDGANNVSESFKLNVINNPPVFNQALTDQTVTVGSI